MSHARLPVDEDGAIRRRRNELSRRQDSAYATRFAAIAARVQAERKIRPAGKGRESYWRHKNQLLAALAEDAEYRALQERHHRFVERFRALSSRANLERIMAGALMVDDRATRHAKLRKAAGVAGGGPWPAGEGPRKPLPGQLDLFDGEG